MTTPSSNPPAGWYPDPSGAPHRRWWDGAQWTEHVQEAAPAAAEPARASRRFHPVGWIALLAAAAVAIGSIGPWAKGLGGIVSVSGTDGGGDGTFTLVLGIAAALCVLASQSKPSAGYALLGGLLGAVCVVIGISDISSVSDRGSGVTVAWGLILVAIAGGTLVLSAGWLALKPSAWS